MARGDKKPGRALGFGLPEPDAEPAGALAHLLAELDDARSRLPGDAFDEMAEFERRVLLKAIKTVQETLRDAKVSLAILVAVNVVMDQVDQEFGRLTKIDELPTRRGARHRRGRPRDAYADMFSALSEVGVLLLQKAIERVLDKVPFSVQVDMNLPGFMAQLVGEFRRLLPAEIEAAETSHYKNQRAVKDAPRAIRKAHRRRDKAEPSD